MTPSERTIRKIIHVDMDAFYASIEQRDHPEFRGKPIAVGGSPGVRGGVVATASYEARKFGVRSAMASSKALQLCPSIIFVKPRFPAYKEVSTQVQNIFKRYTDLIEPLSLDEAYLDVTIDKQGIGSAIEIAKQIRSSIKEELSLTASAGISINKFVAKIASDINKPDGMAFIGPSRIEAFMENLPVEKFYGVGKVTTEKMHTLGLYTGSDLKKLTQAELVKHFGKSGKFFYQIVRGIDDRPVTPDREAKSIGAEDTFQQDLTTKADMKQELEKIATVVYERMKKQEAKGRTVTLKVKFHDFTIINRSQSFTTFVQDFDTIYDTSIRILDGLDLEEKQVRLLGISVSNLDSTVAYRQHSQRDQLTLF